MSTPLGGGVIARSWHSEVKYESLSFNIVGLLRCDRVSSRNDADTMEQCMRSFWGGSHGGVHALSAQGHQQRCTVILLPHDHALSLCLTTHCSRQVRTLSGTSPHFARTIPTPSVGMVWTWYGQSMGGAWAKRGQSWAKRGQAWAKRGQAWACRRQAWSWRGINP